MQDRRLARSFWPLLLVHTCLNSVRGSNGFASAKEEVTSSPTIRASVLDAQSAPRKS